MRADDLARHHDFPVEAFEWFPVGKAVGNVKNHGAELIQKIDSFPPGIGMIGGQVLPSLDTLHLALRTAPLSCILHYTRGIGVD